jgi:O-antigen/teichoic acid export membrane protein
VGAPSGRSRALRKLLRYGSRIQVGSIFQLLNYRLDVVILTFFVPLSSVGYYVVAQTLAELVLTLARAFQGSVLSLVSHYEGDERPERDDARVAPPPRDPSRSPPCWRTPSSGRW